MKHLVLIFSIMLSAQYQLAGQKANDNNIDNPFVKLYFEPPHLTLDNVPYHFKLRVNLLDQFFKRFNMQVNIEGQEILSKDIASLLLVPGAEKYRKDTKRQMIYYITNPPAYYKDTVLYQRFVDTAVDKNVNLNFEDRQWKAICQAGASIDNTNQKITLIMTIVRSGKGYKWIIEDVILPPKYKNMFYPKNLKISISPDSTVFLNPMAHETSFIGMNKIFNSDSIISILSPQFNKNLKKQLFYNIKPNDKNRLKSQKSSKKPKIFPKAKISNQRPEIDKIRPNSQELIQTPSLSQNPKIIPTAKNHPNCQKSSKKQKIILQSKKSNQRSEIVKQSTHLPRIDPEAKHYPKSQKST